jgi:hypothetical protein
MNIRGSAAAQCGKARPYRSRNKGPEAAPLFDFRRGEASKSIESVAVR